LRRDSSDLKWQELKAKVRKRDLGKDRIMRVLSMKEALILQKNATPSQLQRLDVAHIFPVGAHPEMCYEISNVVLLDRYAHECIDNMKDPITGKIMTMEQNLAWWERICGPEQWRALMNVKNRKELEENVSNKLETLIVVNN